jgi:dipeptidyl aminopeptidase/acylaminoacyl peptidase
VHGVEEVAVIDADKGDFLGFNLSPELGNALWSPNGREFLSINDQGNYEYVHLGKETKPLEEGLVPTAWSPGGKSFYAYLDNVLYEIEPSSLTKTEIIVDDRFSNLGKRMLKQLNSGIKIVEYDRHNLLILDQGNNLLYYIPEIWKDSSRVSPNEKLIAFLRVNDNNKGEVWVYNIDLMSLDKISTVEGQLYWSHTSDQLILNEYGENIYLINLRNKETTTLLDFENESFLEVSWIDGGNKLALITRKFFYLSARDIYRVVDTITGRILFEKDIPTVGSGRIEWSKDGKRFYYISNDGQRLVRMELLENNN